MALEVLDQSRYIPKIVIYIDRCIKSIIVCVVLLRTRVNFVQITEKYPCIFYSFLVIFGWYSLQLDSNLFYFTPLIKE